MLSKQDIEFLIELQNKLITQETDCQADPCFWVVAEEKRIWGMEDGYQDGAVLLETYDYETIAENLDEAKQYVLEHFGEELSSEYLEYVNDECDSLYELTQFLDNKGYDGYEIGRYKDQHTIAENTFFPQKTHVEGIS